MLLGYMKTLTRVPCKWNTYLIHKKPNTQKLWHTNHNSYLKKKYHGLWRQVGLELSSDNTAVSMRPCDLAPNAAIMGSLLLHLGLVDVCHALTSIPCNFFLGVDSLNLDQWCVGILVGLRPNHQNNILISRLIHTTKTKS